MLPAASPTYLTVKLPFIKKLAIFIVWPTFLIGSKNGSQAQTAFQSTDDQLKANKCGFCRI
ncbi:hypothetical protein B1690_04500 [Geobacillus sp. 46C-IIa]|nr:hypothetical protein B1690_04500 [Geobacillus sp. 46C-IIa]